MQALLLADDIGFWEVVWWMLIVFFWVMIIWMFIATFADIFQRYDLSGWAKAGWMFLILVLPLLGILLYVCFRPRTTPVEIPMAKAQSRPQVATASTDEIAKAHQLLQTGAITEAEFLSIKARTLA